jgi:acyl dehydratase
MKSQHWLARPKNLSDEGIHSDETARGLGFAGGFVPGVMLYAHVVAALLNQGVDWLRTGSVGYRFRRPVYDGEEVLFTVDAEHPAFTISSPDGSDARALGRLEVTDLPPEVGRAVPVTPERTALGGANQIGVPLQITATIDQDRAAAAIASSGDYAWQENSRTLLPVGLWLNPINLLRTYYDSAVTIHYAGRVWHHSPVYLGETVVKRGHITGFEERKGNQIVSFVVAIETDDGRPVATVEHQSVYKLARAQGEG